MDLQLCAGPDQLDRIWSRTSGQKPGSGPAAEPDLDQDLGPWCMCMLDAMLYGSVV